MLCRKDLGVECDERLSGNPDSPMGSSVLLGGAMVDLGRQSVERSIAEFSVEQWLVFAEHI